MRSTLALFVLLAVAPLACVGASTAANAQYYRCDPYGYDGPPCPRVRVHPRGVPYLDDYSYYYPAARGFGDRNPVPRGNRRGCSVDLGYGRYESCDK